MGLPAQKSVHVRIILGSSKHTMQLRWKVVVTTRIQHTLLGAATGECCAQGKRAQMHRLESLASPICGLWV